MIQYITSRKNKIVGDTIDLRKNSVSLEKKLFVIEGEHLLEMAVKSKNILYVLTKKHLNNIPDEIDQYIVTDDILSKISVSKSAPSVIAVCKYINESIKEDQNIIYLDNVQDPGNLGTILRSSLAFGVFNVLISNNSVNKYNEKAIQASQGSLFSLNIESCNTNKLIDLKKKGYKIIVTLLDPEAIKLSSFNFTKNERYVIVFGNEGQGVSKDVIALADKKVFIEMDNIDSLNVGVAASICLYKLKVDLNK
jgi:TrmH family RNA methyltransferase